ncbi:hypothetical protein CI109_104161 [Kwoniella shandongensis]|uniref:Uncharacterized protein n=1 Tax=Kwoniella shandongensis TaxID=1734106 RepID=A0A5M6C0V3_9TREE|nr:uncharacterized protein CI109_002926 [Kwoniella shandongensis]KAA5528768.1 hypothetical protein CI109_002926 [Kwoniella shandongensis]
MPKRLFDLSDEILLHVAHFANRDHAIPLPSFGPHWENYKSEIDRSVAKDYLALRATCRKLSRLLVPKNLHLKLKSWIELEDWLMRVPTSVLEGIKRLELNIPWDRSDETLIFGKWIALTTFLNTLCSLEELIIRDLPMCRHFFGDDRDTIDLKRPLAQFLPNLTALSIEVQCGNCAAAFPRLLVPAAPKLRHLKMCTNQSITEGEDDEDDGSDDDDQDQGHIIKSGHVITSIYDGWKERYPLDTPAIETLFIRLANGEESCASIIEAVSDFPYLQTLHMSSFKYSLSSVGNIQKINTIGAIIATPSTSGWDLKFSNSDIKDCYPFELFPVILQSLPNLKSFDPMFVVEIDQPRPSPSYATRQITRSAAPSACIPSINAIVVYEERLREAMSVIAETMIQVVPSLTNGAFWESAWTNQTGQLWHRWTWTTKQVNGVRKVVVAEVPQALTKDFASNLDGAMNRSGGQFVVTSQ